MLDLVRPKLTIPEDSKIKINEYRNPYLSKLTIKILPHYSKIKGPTLISPLQNHNNIAITQSLPLWRNENFRIGLLWQQNIRNKFNRSHIGFLAQYQSHKNYAFKTRNLIGNSFLTTNQVSKTFVSSGRLITASIFHSCFFQSTSQYFHSVGGGLCLGNRLTLALNKRIGAETSLKVHYEKPLQNELYLRLKYDTQVERFDESAAEVGVGYYFSKSSSCWLRSAVESLKMQPNLAVQVEYRKQNNHCFLASIQYRNNKSILYIGYKCPTFNFIFPIYGVDSVIPALIGIGVYLIGYFKRKREQTNKKVKRQKNRYDELKLISDKANQNYKKEQILRGLLIEEVYVGEKRLLERFLKENNRHIKLIRDDDYKEKIYDGTVSFRFYVQKGQLHLPKGSKFNMIGLFYRAEEDQQIQVYIKYSKKGKQHEVIFDENDQIKL